MIQLLQKVSRFHIIKFAAEISELKIM